MDGGVPAPLRMFDLDGRVAIVTGASSGLGEGLARALAAVGARVALVARRVDRLEPMAKELGGIAVQCDLADADAVGSVVPQVVEQLGPPEILVNAAGNIFGRRKAQDEQLDDIHMTLDLNLVAPFRLAQDVYPHMVEIGRGAIVNVSSIGGIIGVKGIPQAAYAASKMGLSGLTAELALQWARDSIRVNTIAPGFFQSEITDGMYEDEQMLTWLHRHQPLPVHAVADDFAGAVLWLVSDAGRFVTGQTIVIDGGFTKS